MIFGWFFQRGTVPWEELYLLDSESRDVIKVKKARTWLQPDNQDRQHQQAEEPAMTFPGG